MWENIRWVTKLLEENGEIWDEQLEEGAGIKKIIRNNKKRKFVKKLEMLKSRIEPIEEVEEDHETIRLHEVGPENNFSLGIYEYQKILEVKELGLEEVEFEEMEEAEKRLFDEIETRMTLRDADIKIEATKILNEVIGEVLEKVRNNELNKLEKEKKWLKEEVDKLKEFRIQIGTTPKKSMGGVRTNNNLSSRGKNSPITKYKKACLLKNKSKHSPKFTQKDRPT